MIQLNITDWSYEWDGELVIVTVKDDRGKYYKGSLELIEECRCGKDIVEGEYGYCTKCLNEQDDEKARHENE